MKPWASSHADYPMKWNVNNQYPRPYSPTHMPLVCGGRVRKGMGWENAFVLFIEHGTATKDDGRSAAGATEVLQASAKFGLNLHFAFLSL